jgi:hypothetical protein
MKNIICALSAVALLIASSGCSSIVKNRSGIDAALADKQTLYARADTVIAAARQKQQPKLLENESPVALSYIAAESFLNTYWEKVVADLEQGTCVDRSGVDYSNETGWFSTTNFLGITQTNLNALGVNQSAGATFLADNVAALFTTYFHDYHKLTKAQRDAFINYVKTLTVMTWPAKVKEQYKMPTPPDLSLPKKKKFLGLF